MSRPTKSINVSVGERTKAEKQARLNYENKLKGKSDKLKPSSYLSTAQQKIFNEIVEEMRNAEILGNVDLFLLNTFAIAIDRLRMIEQRINEDFNLIMNRDYMICREKYSKDFFKCCQELSLSQVSRAKMKVLALEEKETTTDPLLTILKSKKK
jgi:phage terminase small subunit